ncbi:hypothetical protein Tco_1003568 [Tanacetum coccineum]|uniref:Bromo domain-containing protein n=1 Tax=Tanacetum coccineum TaxID=301880 RepID=A0ABQ5F9T6_9ASTR
MQLMFIQMKLCPPNKRYDLMDANKKVDLEHVQCPSESKILRIIIKNRSVYDSALQHQHLKELTLTLDDFRTIFHLPQANDNNHASFVPPPSFSDMVPFYKQVLGFIMKLKTVSNSRQLSSTALADVMQIFSNCLTTRRARDAYHNLQDADIMKNIFNSGRNKNKAGMRIPAWMIIEEMKLTEHYKMYAEVFGLDVPLAKSQPTESTQGTHRTPSSPRSPNLATEIAESSVPKRSTVIRFRLPSRQSARLTILDPVPSTEKAAEEIEKLVEDYENVNDSSPPRHDDIFIPDTRLEPRSDKESPEVEIV